MVENVITEKVPRVIKDHSKIYAIMVGVVLLGLFLLNTFAPQYSTSMSTTVFILLAIAFTWAAGRIFWIQRREGIDLEKTLLYFMVIAGVIVFLWKFPQVVPSFSVQAQSIVDTTTQSVMSAVMSVLGVN